MCLKLAQWKTERLAVAFWVVVGLEMAGNLFIYVLHTIKKWME